MSSKYTYYAVIQQNWGSGWDDVDFHETNSLFQFRTTEDRANFRGNVKAYRESQTAPVRVIHRKELNTVNA